MDSGRGHLAADDRFEARARQNELQHGHRGLYLEEILAAATSCGAAKGCRELQFCHASMLASLDVDGLLQMITVDW